LYFLSSPFPRYPIIDLDGAFSKIFRQRSEKKSGCQLMSASAGWLAGELTSLWTAARFLYIMMANQ
jgi:hypothetical protein